MRHPLLFLGALLGTATACAPPAPRAGAPVAIACPLLDVLIGRLGARDIRRDGPGRIVGLDLTDMKLSDDDIGAVAELETLRELRFTRSNLTDARLAKLASLHQLESLDLKYTPITGAGLAAVKHLTHLKRLSLWGTDVDDAGLKHVASLHALRELDLARTRITDASLKSIASLPRLERLGLWGTALEGHGLRELAGCRTLREVWISPVVAREKAVHDLQARRPDLKIHRPERVD